MSSFDETKHPRDNDGKFTDGNGGDKSESEKKAELVKKYSSEPERDLKEENLKSNQSELTKQEYALYYKEIQKIERGEYSSQVTILSKDMRAVFVETNKRATLILDANTTKVLYSKSFKTYDEMIDFMNEFVKGEKK